MRALPIDQRASMRANPARRAARPAYDRALRCTLGVLALQACSSAGAVGAGRNSVASAASAAAEHVYEVPLELLPIRDARRTWALRPSDPGREGRASLQLAFGEGVSRDFSVRLELARASGGCEIQPGDVRLQAAESSAAELVDARLDANTLRLRIHRVGTAVVTVRAMYAPRTGDCSVAARESVATALRVELDVRRVPSRTIQRVVRCGATVWMMGASGRIAHEVDFATAEEDAIRFHNVRVAGGFRLRSNIALPGWRFDAERGLLLPRRRARLTLEPRGGERAIAIEWAVSPSEIDGLDVSFFVAGSAGSTVPLEDGMSLSGSHRKMRGIYASVVLRAATATVCDAPDLATLELESTTPAVCSLRRDARGLGDGTQSDSVFPHAIRLDRDGVCAVRLRGATLDHGRGLQRAVSASFSNVAQFVDFSAAPNPAAQTP